MSFILIGIGKKTSKNLGAAGQEQPCVWCSYVVFYHLILTRTWLTYFLIPVIPYRSEYHLQCPACARSMMLSGEEVKAAKRGELILRRE